MLDTTLKRNGKGSLCWISLRKFPCSGNAYIYPRKSTSVPPSGVTVSDIINISLPKHQVQMLSKVFCLSHVCVSVPRTGQEYQPGGASEKAFLEYSGILCKQKMMSGSLESPPKGRVDKPAQILLATKQEPPQVCTAGSF